MLVLGRTKNESIDIFIPASTEDRVIKVMVCEARCGRDVRIGIQADKDVKVLRSELKWRDTNGL